METMNFNNHLILVVVQGLISIISVVIAAKLSAKKVANELKPKFYTYLDSDIHPMLQSAKHDIYIIVGLGNAFLSTYSNDLLVAAANGVKIHYLYLCDSKIGESDEYMYGHISNDLDEKKDLVTRKLNSIQQTISVLKDSLSVCGSLEVRRFQQHLSASYIAVDLDIENTLTSDSSIIQAMIYQYRATSSESITSTITPENSSKIFRTTSRSIHNVWNSAEKV